MYLKLQSLLNNRNKLILFRLSILIFVFLEGIVVPLVVDNAYYAEIEYIKNIAWSCLIGTIGFTGGTQYLFFTKKNKKIFTQISGPYIVTTLIVSILFSVYFNNIWILFICLSIMGCQFNEQILKVNEKFFFSFLVKPILSISIIILVFFLNTSVNILITISFLVSFIIMYLIRKNIYTFSISWNRIKWGDTVKSGLLLSLGTGIYGLMILSERKFGMENFADNMGAYSLFVSFTNMSVVILTTLNYIYSIEIGKITSNGLGNDKLIKKLYSSIVIGIILLISTTLFLPILFNKFYPDYNQIGRFEYFLISFPRILFFVVGSITSYLLYINKLKKLTISIVLIFLVQSILYVSFKNIEFSYFLSIFGFGIMTQCVISLLIINKNLKSQKLNG